MEGGVQAPRDQVDDSISERFHPVAERSAPACPFFAVTVLARLGPVGVIAGVQSRLLGDEGVELGFQRRQLFTQLSRSP